MNKKLQLFNFDTYLEKRVSAGTRKLYMRSIEIWFQNLGSSEPTKELAQQYIDSLVKLAPNTVAIIAHAIMRYFRWIGQAVELDRPKVHVPEPEYLSVDQVKQLKNASITQLERTLVVLVFDSGIRISEFLNLTVDNIHFDTKMITVTVKGNRVVDVNIGDTAIDELSKWLETRPIKSNRVFGDMNYQSAYKMLRAIGARVNIEVHPHMLRHSRAIQMLTAGTEMYVVQQQLNHVNLGTTANIYGRFKAIDLRKKIPDSGI
jgi:integrase/recombinase XerD